MNHNSEMDTTNLELIKALLDDYYQARQREIEPDHTMRLLNRISPPDVLEELLAERRAARSQLTERAEQVRARILLMLGRRSA